ncbi:MAG TPA: DNA polymerase IV [Thermomicrobiales bacterium]|nr:DNA polymerase IV [Thermomicrobiales bacterium]
MADRWIAHVDLDAFFASAEVRRDPALRGRPVIVGGALDGRGVVSSATYEARARGVRSAMPMAEARRRCPDAVFLPGDFAYYRELSAGFRAILRDLSPVVEVASVDEAYLDAGGLPGGGPPLALVTALKHRLRADLGLTASVGLAPNKVLAKIASDLEKPDGAVLVGQGEGARFLAPLAVGRIPGVGPKAQARLAACGIRTIGELAAAPPFVLRDVFGRRGTDVALLARGVDDRSLEPESPARSVGHERTFAEDVADRAVLRAALRDLCDRTAAQLRRGGLGGRIVALKLRHADFRTTGRQRALHTATDAPRTILATVEALLDEALAATGWRRIRLLGVRVAGVGPLAQQLDLFDPTPLRDIRVNAALDQVRERFGDRAVTSCRLLVGGGRR